MLEELNSPICFVVIGYGIKDDYPRNRKLNLDKTYNYIIKPAVEQAGYKCFKCSEQKGSGLIDRDMFKALYEADLVIADITTLNANALYELGIRHGVKPFSTIIMAQDTEKLPFDFNHNRIFRYSHMGDDIGCTEAEVKVTELRELIEAVKENPEPDSPFYIFTGIDKLEDLTQLKTPTSVITNIIKSKTIALLPLFGRWNDLNGNDKSIIKNTIGLNDEDFSNLKQNSAVQLNNSHWLIERTKESVDLMKSYLTPSILHEYQKSATDILSEIDPMFELPKENRFMANLYNKKTIYSKDIRKGICESLVWLSINPEIITSHKYLIDNIIFDVLSKTDWQLWASLNNLLPILAEACPDTFLKCLQKQITDNSEMIKELFNQEGNGITSTTLLSGILWSLETIAWFPKYFQISCICLAELAKLDNGGHFSNRPINSLKNLLLPWINNCNTTCECKVKTVEKILSENYEKISWNLLIGLLPDSHSVSFGTRKPVYNLSLLENYKQTVTLDDYQYQIKAYSDIAIKLMKKDDSRIYSIIDNLSQLNPDSHNEIFEYLESKTVFFNNSLHDSAILWEQITELTRKHKKFANSKWAYNKDIINRIDLLAEKIKPKDKKVIYKYLFTSSEYDISDEVYGDSSNQYDWQDIRKKALYKRKAALKDLINTEKFGCLSSFIENEFMAKTVAETLADFKQKSIDNYLINNFEKYDSSLLNIFIKYYFLVSSWNRNDDMLKNIEFESIDDQKKMFVLLNSAFEKRNWDLVDNISDEFSKKYWSEIDQNIYSSSSDLIYAIKKFNSVSRSDKSLKCIYISIFNKKEISSELIFETLNKNLLDQKLTADAHELIEIFKYLEKIIDIDYSKLADFEWAFYTIFKYDYQNIPQALYKKLANDPAFYISIIKMGFVEDDCKEKPIPSDEESARAMISWDILRNYKLVPGLSENGYIEEISFKNWIDQVLKLAKENNRLKTTKNYLGKLLYHSPADKSGLWIDKQVANYLDEFSNNRMREGFRSECINSRGCYTIDISGQSEKNISNSWLQKAEELRKNNFNNFASEIDGLVQFYQDSAEQSKMYSNYENMELDS